MSYPKVDILYLSEKDMLDAGVNDVVKCTDTMEEVVKLLDDGDYRMGGENGNSHGCMISFPDNPHSRTCRRTVRTAALWQCRHIWAASSIWQV